MRINKTMEEKIERKYSENRKAKATNRVGLGLELKDSLGGPTIFKNGWAITDLNELSQMIEELTIMKDTIEEITGFEF